MSKFYKRYACPECANKGDIKFDCFFEKVIAFYWKKSCCLPRQDCIDYTCCFTKQKR
jgi:hypothetical protein